MDKRTWKFSEVAAALAEINDIANVRRTAFDARLKNFHRLGFPADYETTKGKAAQYNAAQIYSIALAIELTQLGLSPERVITVLLSGSYATGMAARMACNSNKDSDKLLMYLYFDPSALDPLQADLSEDKAGASFFYAGQGILRDMLSEWPEDKSRRLSLLLVSKLIELLVEQFGPDFEADLSEWAATQDAIYSVSWTSANLTKLAQLLDMTEADLIEQFGGNDVDPQA